MGSSAVGEDEDGDLINLEGRGRNSLSRHSEVRMTQVCVCVRVCLLL